MAAQEDRSRSMAAQEDRSRWVMWFTDIAPNTYAANAHFFSKPGGDVADVIATFIYNFHSFYFR